VLVHGVAATAGPFQFVFIQIIVVIHAKEDFSKTFLCLAK